MEDNNRRIDVCTLCGGEVVLENHVVVYGQEHSDWPYIYLCTQCGAYVGVHEGTFNPLGTPGDEQTRQARRIAHSAFDLLWKDGEMSRSDAYRWLAIQLNLEEKDCHIGMFDVEQCGKVVEVVMKRVR